MKLTYNLLTQSVSFEWTPEDQIKLVGSLRKNVREMFLELARDIKNGFLPGHHESVQPCGVHAQQIDDMIKTGQGLNGIDGDKP